MNEDFGTDYITIVDDEGQEFELEVLDSLEMNGNTYMAFLPADMDENDPDFGMIILKAIEDENGDTLYESVDDEDELDKVYDEFVKRLFDDEDEE
ncbi:MAG: DUF1292 domain-containing protein [Oscillospiraceae bacterium]|nr:DUF1292 domain-containing protein [Oscillospiraceae bacterium]